jgi:hypothetical protein
MIYTWSFAIFMIQHSFIQDAMNQWTSKVTQDKPCEILGPWTIPRKSTMKLEKNKDKWRNLKNWRLPYQGPCSPDPWASWSSRVSAVVAARRGRCSGARHHWLNRCGIRVRESRNVIRCKRIYNFFLCSMLVLHQWLYVLFILRGIFMHFRELTY